MDSANRAWDVSKEGGVAVRRIKMIERRRVYNYHTRAGPAPAGQTNSSNNKPQSLGSVN